MDLVKVVSNKYPDLWGKIAEAHKHNAINGYSEWPEWCYIPFANCMNIIFDTENIQTTGKKVVEYGRLASILITLAPWRASKEIFAMDPDIEQLLSEQTDVKVDPETLMKLPYYCFYVKTNFLTLDNRKKLDGFFVSLEYDYREKTCELRITFCIQILFFWKSRSFSNTRHRKKLSTILLPCLKQNRVLVKNLERRRDWKVVLQI